MLTANITSELFPWEMGVVARSCRAGLGVHKHTEWRLTPCVSLGVVPPSAPRPATTPAFDVVASSSRHLDAIEGEPSRGGVTRALLLLHLKHLRPEGVFVSVVPALKLSCLPETLTTPTLPAGMWPEHVRSARPTRRGRRRRRPRSWPSARIRHLHVSDKMALAIAMFYSVLQFGPVPASPTPLLR